MKALHIFSLSIIAIFVVACSNGKSDDDPQESRSDLKAYFFPSDSLEPYIYVYAEENNPLDEKIYRVYTLRTPEKEHLVVEKFNANFRITEGYSYDLTDDLNVVDHMIVDARGKKRKANLSASVLFPENEEEKSLFISDFPAHIDSLVGVYKSEKTVVNKMKSKVLGDETESIEVIDEVTLSFVNPDTQKGSANTVEIHRVYAKNFGLTEWYTEDRKVHYKLKRIFSNDWWKEHAQGPVVKGVVK